MLHISFYFQQSCGKYPCMYLPEIHVLSTIASSYYVLLEVFISYGRKPDIFSPVHVFLILKKINIFVEWVILFMLPKGAKRQEELGELS